MTLMWTHMHCKFVARPCGTFTTASERNPKPVEAKLAFSPKRAMAELRHSSSLGARAGSSPMKRDDTASPLIHEHQADDDDDGRSRHPFRDRDRPIWSYFSFLSDDPRVFQHNSRISLFLVLFIVVVGVISVFSIVNHLVSYLLLLLCSTCEYSVTLVTNI